MQHCCHSLTISNLLQLCDARHTHTNSVTDQLTIGPLTIGPAGDTWPICWPWGSDWKTL